MADIAAISAIAKRAGVLLAVDNTFMSSYFQRPLELGADMAVNRWVAGCVSAPCPHEVCRPHSECVRVRAEGAVSPSL